jgi:hypothetical protein
MANNSPCFVRERITKRKPHRPILCPSCIDEKCDPVPTIRDDLWSAHFLGCRFVVPL